MMNACAVLPARSAASARRARSDSSSRIVVVLAMRHCSAKVLLYSATEIFRMRQAHALPMSGRDKPLDMEDRKFRGAALTLFPTTDRGPSTRTFGPTAEADAVGIPFAFYVASRG